MYCTNMKLFLGIVLTSFYNAISTVLLSIKIFLFVFINVERSIPVSLLPISHNLYNIVISVNGINSNSEKSCSSRYMYNWT